MKLLIALTIYFVCLSVYANTSLTLSQEIHQTAELSFIPHVNYIAMQVPFSPIQKLLQKVRRMYRPSLKNRGEAHITVLTPPEFNSIRSKISIKELNKMVMEFSIQESRFDIVCLGRVTTTLNNKQESALFVVINSYDLLQLREEIAHLYYQRGGTKIFIPEHFYPHITVGFTKRDLHDQDGVIKDQHSCILPL